jgi:hypothetical protein
MRDYHFMGAGETTEGPLIAYRETRSGESGNCRGQPHPDINVMTIYSSPIARAGNEQTLHMLFLDALSRVALFELDDHGTSFAA